MAAYVMLKATIPDFGPLGEYMERLPEILEGYGARYLIRAGEVHVMEGSIGQHPIKALVEFPDMETAKRWYTSSEYEAVKPIRTNNSEGNVLFIEGIADGEIG